MPSTLSRALASCADWLEGQLEHRKWACLALFSVVFLAACLSIAATKVMWFDELATYYPAKLPTARETVSFFAEGLDVHTPASALMLRASIALFGDNHVAVRIPYVLGFWLMTLCVFRFVSRRFSLLYAAAAMAFPLITSAFYYATEARPYAPIMGLTALAMVCWQQILEGQRRTISLAGLWICLAACVSLHYFAILIWIPFGLAELVRSWTRKRVDWPVWIVMVTALLPLLGFLPAMQAARAAYVGGMWSKPNFGQIENTYRFMLTLAFGPLLGTLVLWAAITRGQPSQESRSAAPPVPERVLVGALAALPIFGVPLSLLAGGFVERYALETLVGVTIFLAFTAAMRSRGDRLLAAAMVICFLGWFGWKTASTVRRQMAESGGLPLRAAQPFGAKTWMRDLEQSTLRVVATPLVFYQQLQFYAPAPVGARIYYLTSRQYANHYEGMDTGEANAINFSKRIPLQVADYDAFVASHRRFLLCAETTNPTWHIEKLRDDGAILRLIRREGTYFLFDVAMPAP